MRYEIKMSSSDMSDIRPHIRGPEYLDCLHEIMANVRIKSKYGDVQDTTWIEVYDYLWTILRDWDIDAFEE